jgi:hypothetical protein
MVKAKNSLVPIRGSVEDWGPGKFQRNLEHKDSYARKMREQVAKGPPDFERLLSLGAAPPEKGASTKNKVAVNKKSNKTAAKKSKKKKTKQRR